MSFSWRQITNSNSKSTFSLFSLNVSGEVFRLDVRGIVISDNVPLM